MARGPRARPSISRVLPDHLRSRLVLTVLIANVALMIVGGSVLWLLDEVQRPGRIGANAADKLAAVAAGLDKDAHRLNALAATIALHLGARDATGLLDEMAAHEFLAETVEASGIDAASLVATDGVIIAAAGSPPARVAIAYAVSAVGATETAGLLPVGHNEVGIVSVQRADQAGGYVFAIDILSPDDLAAPGVVSFARGATPSPSGVAVLRVPSRHLGGGTIQEHDDSHRLELEVIGVDGSAAGVLTFDLLGPRTTFDLFGLSLVVAAGFAVITSLTIGTWLTTLIRRPLEALVTHAKRHGHAALEGHPVRTLAVDTNLPVEMRDLVAVYNRLLDHFVRYRTRAAEAANLMRFAIETSTEAKILLRHGQAVLANAAATTLTGTPANATPQEWDTTLSTLRFTSDDAVAYTAEEAFALARHQRAIVRVSRRGVPSRWVDLRVIEHDDPARTTLITMRDVSEDRRVGAIHDEIISLVTHDLRAPLTVISGYLDLLDRPLDAKTRDKASAAARQSTERMAELLDDLLSATRAEELFAPDSLDPVSVSCLATEVVSAFQHVSRHELRVATSGRGYVLGEERRIRQAIVNLVSNALTHTPVTGAVDIIVEQNGGRVLLVVQDEGPGIPAAEREKVFERYSRLSSPSEHRAGIGLGLYIVRTIVESHGGVVHISDRPDGRSGAYFVVDLPAYQSAQSEDRSRALQTSAQDGTLN